MKSNLGLQRAKSVTDILKIKRQSFDFEGLWEDAFGSPEKCGIWFIWGNSGNGKSSFVMQLCKYLAKFGKVSYDSLEEGSSLTMQNTLIRFGMSEVNRRFLLLDNEPIDQLSERLLQKRSPDIAVIDSFQYTQMSYRQYIAFKEKHRNKLLIFISHADGKMPAGRSAKSVMYDASLKIWVEGYKAFSKGRFIGKTGMYTIWDQGATNYWGE